MITRSFLEKYFKHHKKLKLYMGERPVVITREYHLCYNSGNREFNIHDCSDLEQICKLRKLTRRPVKDVE
jgi:hypothetical protein